MGLLYNAIAFLLSLLPALALITGIILTARARREHGKAAMIGLWGCLVLLLALVMRLVWSLVVPHLVGSGGMDTFQIVMLLHSAIDALLTMTGFGLLIWAVVARRAHPGAAAPEAHLSAPHAPAWQTPPWEAPAPHQPHPPYGQEPR
ncbi:hypothetical protein GCM10010149_65840 [Nonomuraea roseoviolacea subsp. roseoviolacea]|uniref:Uncharacterized protein n=1 Tax=Nonomuraea roseoviolacea subsp. carminata TaxID=160689 RepID=A0ABT1K963_9ACTN|nr:hypothetical protein [Nonomuraea roseoviolacea]MCP2349519.1 hypothetical protein [Nonomuraea roseoviolacea subsp. carminata]